MEEEQSGFMGFSNDDSTNIQYTSGSQQVGLKSALTGLQTAEEKKK